MSPKAHQNSELNQN